MPVRFDLQNLDAPTSYKLLGGLDGHHGCHALSGEVKSPVTRHVPISDRRLETPGRARLKI